jgi:hypothetical protein
LCFFLDQRLTWMPVARQELDCRFDEHLNIDPLSNAPHTLNQHH